MGSSDIRLYNYPKLMDKSYEWYFQSYTQNADIEATFRKVCDTRRPRGFDERIPYYREAVGVMDVVLSERASGEPLKATVGAFEDYYFLMKRRQYATKIVVPPDVVEAGETRMVSFVQEFAREAAIAFLRIQDAFAANIWISGGR